MSSLYRNQVYNEFSKTTLIQNNAQPNLASSPCLPAFWFNITTTWKTCTKFARSLFRATFLRDPFALAGLRPSPQVRARRLFFSD